MFLNILNIQKFAGGEKTAVGENERYYFAAL
jgi:hypothetical protein